jgi:class 3 adenylate cyclase/tetratricopeptide (TPR) repeat protein
MGCQGCGTSNAEGRRFCSQCGAPLAVACEACGSQNEATDRFCGRCGASLDPLASGRATARPTPEPHDERRLVSVLFVDLVDFTSLSERRDAEEVRELLSVYFERCSTLVGRYGGVVEKFIGDAVMAVWGTPIAREDDADRAVRAGLEIVDAVGALGDEVGAPGLRARAGVLTGEAAVSLGAETEGMVLGDLVNTASRIQSLADHGTVLVGDSTRWATESHVAYEDRGHHAVKGKAEPIHVWRAVRVTSGSGEWDETDRLEAPLVGRDRELRLVKESFHTAGDERRPHLVSVLGSAGVGKTRLAREFGRYLDGLVDDVFWHRGRCPAYGDGLTYWALVEMVKMRCGILEDETGPTATAKLRELLEQTVPEETERRWMEPRLASLLSLEGAVSVDRDELFSAWSLLFERLADESTTVLIFEDLEHADTSLLDFIDYLLERGQNSPLFILTLARPELVERRPAWGAGHRSFTSIHLEPLPEPSMQQILKELVPGLPAEIERSVLDRAQGVPLYALETVRMLLDRGLLEQDGSVYRTTGEITDLAIPETLQALIAARLDGLDAQERAIVQDGSVLGRSFFKEGVAAVGGAPLPLVEPVLTRLVRKEVLTLKIDPRSPDRGQYSFLQDLVRQVAYGTIAKRERKTKHLAAAAFLTEQSVGDEAEFVEVLANHFVQAYELEPADSDAAQIKEKALDTLRGAAERAAVLGASVEAQAYLERAAEMADDPLARAEVIERAGEVALMGDRPDAARRLFGEALGIYEDELQAHAAARVSAGLAEVDWSEGRLEEALDRMEKAFAVLSEDEPDEDLATLAAQLGRLHFFRGDRETALSRVETALDIAETLNHRETIAQGLITMGMIVGSIRPQQELALTKHALEFALEHDLSAAALRAYNNRSELFFPADGFDDAIESYQDGIALAERVGNRFWRDLLLSEVTAPLFVVGRWDDALRAEASLSSPERAMPEVLGRLAAIPRIHISRGDLAGAERECEIHARYETSSSFQERASWLIGSAAVESAHGRLEATGDAASEALQILGHGDIDSLLVKFGLKEGMDAAWALRSDDRVRAWNEVVSVRTPNSDAPVHRAFVDLGRARLGILTEDDPEQIEAWYASAAASLRACGARFWLATTLVEWADPMLGDGRLEEANRLLTEARPVLEENGALVWLARLDPASR